MEGYDPQKDYPLYWGLVLDNLKQELAAYFAHIKNPDLSEKHSLACPTGVIYFLPDQFLPLDAKPELQEAHKAKMSGAVILMGMNCWHAFQPSAMAFCRHLGASLMDELRTEENQLKIRGWSESTSAVKIDFEWTRDFPALRVRPGTRMEPRPEAFMNRKFINMDDL